MVESCLPEKVLRAWHSNNYDIESNSKSRLDVLMIFLKKEIENEERISLAVSGFNYIKKKSSFLMELFQTLVTEPLTEQSVDMYGQLLTLALNAHTSVNR